MDDFEHDFLRSLPPPSPRGRSTEEIMGRQKRSFSVVKYIFFTFNVFLWLIGCGVLALAIWLWVTRGPSTTVTPTYSFLSASSLCIISSIIILAIGFTGCCGAFLENQCLLIGYFVMVFLVFVLEITAGTLGFVMKDKVRELVRSEMTGGIHYNYRTAVQIDMEYKNTTYINSDVQGWSSTLDSLQRELRCCGANNHTDWYYVDAWPHQQRVPDSCCLTVTPGCGAATPDLWFPNGCLDEMDYWFTKNMYILGVTGITVGSIQILAMVAAIAQFCYIRSKRFPL